MGTEASRHLPQKLDTTVSRAGESKCRPDFSTIKAAKNHIYVSSCGSQLESIPPHLSKIILLEKTRVMVTPEFCG